MAAFTNGANLQPSDFPPELKERTQNFHAALKEVREVLNRLLSQSLEDVTKDLKPLDRARLDLSILYATNSLFWTYLATVGEDPKEHGIRKELERIKEYMMRAKQIADKAKMPRLDQGAAGRFVRSSLWEAKTGTTGGDEATPAEDGSRKRPSGHGTPGSGKRRK